MPSTSIHAEASVATRTDTTIAAGLGNHLPIGDYSGADYRSAVRFPVPAGWSAWTAITKATLSFYISDHQHVGPKNSSIFVSRMTITAPIWSKGAGSQNCESGFTGANNTQYDDIASTATDRVSFSSGSTANAAKSVDVTAAMRYYWGNGANNSKPVFVFDNNGAGQYTELWSAQKTGGYDLILTIDYEVQSPPTAPTPTGPASGVISQTDTPTFSWTHHDPQNDAQSNAEVRVYDAGGATLLYTWNPTAGGNQSLVAPVALLRGTTYQWEVRTADATAWGPYSPKQSFSIKANPVVSVSSTRKMVWANNGPRLVAEWSSDQPQGQFRVTAPGYDSGIRPGADQSWVLDTLALTNGAAVNITVQVWNTDSPALTASAARSFTPRFGSTMHYRRLAAVPTNWQTPVVDATTPAGTTLYVEYGSGGNTGGPTSGWYSAPSSLPKPYNQDLWYRAWFIPNATQTPTLNRIDIPYDSTVATIDKWGAAVWPWEDSGPLPAPFSIDTGEAVYGTRSLRCDPNTSGDFVVASNKFKVRAGRSYVISGLMRTQGDAGSWFQLQTVSASCVAAPTLHKPGVLTDWERYKSAVWVAPADMDVFITVGCSGAVPGSTAWWDGIKVEESIIATPWNPAQVGATTVDAGGIQIDGLKGGLIRYKGIAGGLRDVVEGGVNGLKFGGDTELRSLKRNTLQAGPAGSFAAHGLETASGDGGTGASWATVAHGAILSIYTELSFVASVSFLRDGMGSIADWQTGLLRVKVRQQTAMPSQPQVLVATEGSLQGADVAVVVTVVSATESRFEVWLKSPLPWGSYTFAILHDNEYGGAWYVLDTDQPLVPALPAGTVYYGRNLRSGGAFPTAYTSLERFFRTDLGVEFYYGGAGRWYTTQLFSVMAIPHFDPPFSASGSGRLVIPFAPQWSDVYIESIVANVYIAGPTALSAANKWTISTRGKSIVFDSGPVDIGRRAFVYGDYLQGPNAYDDLTFTKTGAPGSLFQQVSVYYRGAM